MRFCVSETDSEGDYSRNIAIGGAHCETVAMSTFNIKKRVAKSYNFGNSFFPNKSSLELFLVQYILVIR